MANRQVELLAPAGSYGSMTAAVNAGADAVYIGGSRFGARAYADNLDEESMIRAIDFAHLHGCRIYMTVNTLMKESEISGLFSYMKPYYEAGLDAVLVQDLGALRLMHRWFPDLPLHISTQMTVTGKYSARTLREMGAVRVVPARELSLSEIRGIAETTGMEVETFVHGALCYCYSGQCLFSSLIGGRSGNRGRCAQTCRLPFDLLRDGEYLNRKNEKYLLSLKDLCTLDILPEILDAGVCSLKIEGRMKSPRYTAGVVSIYRKYVDRYLESGREGYRVEEADRNALLSLFDRGGQSEGYYKRHNGRDMVVLKEKPAFREPDQKLYDYLDRTYVEAVKKIPISGSAFFEAGKPARICAEYTLTLRGDGESFGKGGSSSRYAAKKASAASLLVQNEYGTVEEAKNAPMDEERIRRQLMKTGDTPFVFEKLEVTVRGNVFVPVQELNRMRRDLLAKLEEEILKLYRRSVETEEAAAREAARGEVAKGEVVRGEIGRREVAEGETGGKEAGGEGRPSQGKKPASAPEFSVLVSSREQFEAALSRLAKYRENDGNHVFSVYLSSEEFDAKDWRELVACCHKKGILCYLMMPRIFRENAERYFLSNLETLRTAGFDAAGIASMEEPGFLKKYAPGLRRYFDFGMYAMNREAEAALYHYGADRLTIPVELNAREIAEAGLSGELIVYGRIPVMVSAQCLKKTAEGCGKVPETLWLKDRKGKEFPVRNQCRFCYNTIYNESPLSLHGLRAEVERLHPAALRLNFTVEDAGTTEAVIAAFYEEFISAEDRVAEGNGDRVAAGRAVEGSRAETRRAAEGNGDKAPLGRAAEGFPAVFTRGHFKRGVE